jgi:hypothetical protein
MSHVNPPRAGSVRYAGRMIADTTPDAARVRLAIYRRMAPQQRCAIAAQMSADARAIALAGIRQRHPGYDEQQARLALFRLLLGDELFRRVWPRAAVLDP